MIVYLHGFNSSPQSGKAQQLGRHMDSIGRAGRYACPALSPHPAQAVAQVEALMARHADEPFCFIGSSLGGFYATHLAETRQAKAVLINPAIEPHVGLAAYLGPQKNLHTGEGYVLAKEDLEGWRRLVAPRIDPERYLLLLETGDEVLDWRAAARRYEGARMVVRDGGDHSLQSFPEHIPRILAFAGAAA